MLGCFCVLWNELGIYKYTLLSSLKDAWQELLLYLLRTSVEKKWLYFSVTLKRIRVWPYAVVFCVFLHFSPPSTNDALLLLQGYNNPKWWSHSNVFRIHSRDWTPATSVSGKRLENQIRCCCCCCFWALPQEHLRLKNTWSWVTGAQWKTTQPLNTTGWLCVCMCFSHQQICRKAWQCKSWWKKPYLFCRGHRLARLCLCALYSCRP